MSRENVELLRRALEAFNRHGIEAILDQFHPEIEVVDLPHVPEARIRHGREEVKQWFGDLAEVWENLRMEMDEFIEVDEHTVVTAGRIRGRGRESGLQLEQSGAAVFMVRDGMLVRWELYPDRRTALEAAGQNGA